MRLSRQPVALAVGELLLSHPLTYAVEQPAVPLMPKRHAGDPPAIPHVPVPTRTLVMEAESQRQLLWFDGLLNLPIGARIEFTNMEGQRRVELEPERFPAGRVADGIVVGVRLWDAQSESPILVLDVQLATPGDPVLPALE